MASLPPSSSSRVLKLEENKIKQRESSERSRSSDTRALSPSSSRSDEQKDMAVRSKSHSLPPLPTSSCRRGRRPNDGSDNHSNTSSQESEVYQFEYESPTESLSSSLSSFPVDRNNSTPEIYCSNTIKKDHLKDDSKSGRSSRMSKKTKSGVLSSGDGVMVEVAKITALVEVELQSQRDKHKDQLNRTVAKFKDRRENFQREIDQLIGERDEARRELEMCKRTHASQKRAAERNDRLQFQQKNRIESLEEQRELFGDLQDERDALLDEVARSQEQQQTTKDELFALKVRVREDSQKRLSVMECLSTSWDSEKKEAKQTEALLNTELDMMSKTLKAEQEFLKNKNREFAQLEAQYRSTKTELRSIKMTITAKKDEIDDELRREREPRNQVSEEHKHILKLKNNEIYLAETTIRNLKAELKSAREKLLLKEESSDGAKKSNEKNNVANSEVKTLREENSRLNTEIKELQKQVESYLANMALQQEFCDSLKSRIYKEQENEQGQVEEIHKLRKRVKKQMKEAVEKDIEIHELKQLLGDVPSSPIKVKSKTSRDLSSGKKSSLKKSKSSSRKSGYKTS